jgi:hypothetical protein
LAEEVSMRDSTLFAIVVLGVMVSACGTGTAASDSPGASSAAYDEPFVIEDGEMMVSCGSGGPGWPPSIMTEGVQGVLTEDEARRIFQSILNDPMTGEEAALSLFPDGVDVDWRVLREDGDSLIIGLGRWTEQGPIGPTAHKLEVVREGSTWRAAGWGDCQLSPVLKDGNSWAEVIRYEGDASSARLTAQVSERECTSGRDPDRFLHEPFVVETSERVTIYWTSEPPIGGQDCQGNPSIDRVVELEQPLGTRLVLDGFSYPPREVRAR